MQIIEKLKNLLLLSCWEKFKNISQQEINEQNEEWQKILLS